MVALKVILLVFVSMVGNLQANFLTDAWYNYKAATAAKAGRSVEAQTYYNKILADKPMILQQIIIKECCLHKIKNGLMLKIIFNARAVV
jgi:hypothetical protein